MSPDACRKAQVVIRFASMIMETHSSNRAVAMGLCAGSTHPFNSGGDLHI